MRNILKKYKRVQSFLIRIVFYKINGDITMKRMLLVFCIMALGNRNTRAMDQKMVLEPSIAISPERYLFRPIVPDISNATDQKMALEWQNHKKENLATRKLFHAIKKKESHLTTKKPIATGIFIGEELNVRPLFNVTASHYTRIMEQEILVWIGNNVNEYTVSFKPTGRILSKKPQDKKVLCLALKQKTPSGNWIAPWVYVKNNNITVGDWSGINPQ